VFDWNGNVFPIVVLKIGGSVLTSTKAFRRAAHFLRNRREAAPDERIVVVVSAQKRSTDTLERRAQRIVPRPNERSLDLLWSTGELRSVALLALHLQAVGVSSVGLNVQETGLVLTLDNHSSPEVADARGLKKVLEEYGVVVVPGFLATDRDGVIVSLGRGGSDLSAILLAIGLKASRCELVKDVPGYFVDDPRENPDALHLPSLSFEKALEMAEQGCQLVQHRALQAAAKADLPLVLRSMSERAPASIIAPDSRYENPEILEELAEGKSK
jgi:aspartate kinase